MSVPAAISVNFDSSQILFSARPLTPRSLQNSTSSNTTAPHSMSSNLSTQQQGQNHDREGSAREDGDGSFDGQESHTSSGAGSEESGDHDSEDDEPDDMDTTLDGGASGPNWGAAEALDHFSAVQVVQAGNVPNPNLVRLSSAGNSIHSDQDTDMGEVRNPPISAAPGFEASANMGSTSAVHNFPDDRDDVSLDDDEPMDLRWRPIREDISVPSEEEMNEIENTTEFSALDDAHWEAKTFTPLEDPELTPLESGRIEWQIDNYNGTKEKPNTERIMRSQTVQIGGYDWRIKFFPKGNDSDYISVYIECPDLLPTEEEMPSLIGSEDGGDEITCKPNSEDEACEATSSRKPSTKDNRELQHCPLPILPPGPKFKRKSVAAQISVVLFNPEEPRVYQFHSATHRFCPGSADWGWTRFYGPLHDIQYRRRGQRQALLRNDKLAFKAYIRLVHDPTGCMWEHTSRDNQWDSFAMTGLQALQDDAYLMAGGNLISAVALLMLFKPFRKLLYDVKVPDLDRDPFANPKQPLTAAMQSLLFLMRFQNQPGAGPVSLDVIHCGLDHSGIEITDKQDVVEVLEILTAKLDHELRNTHFQSRLRDLLGPSNVFPRISVRNVSSVQQGLKTAELSDGSTVEQYGSPELLPIELRRQHFDTKTRKWKKLVNKVELNEVISFNGRRYVLYGFVKHSGHLQSGSYCPLIRPNGPNGLWYLYQDGRRGNKVVCGTRRLAVEKYQGAGPNGKHDELMAVAYLVMYVREDVAADAFASDSETEWVVPSPNVCGSRCGALHAPRLNQMLVDGQLPPHQSGDRPKSQTPIKIAIIRDTHFAGYGGRGVFCIEDGTAGLGQRAHSTNMLTLTFEAATTLQEISERVVGTWADISDSRQCRFWKLSSEHDSIYRPLVRYTSSYCFETPLRTAISTSCVLWLHVIPTSGLRNLPVTKLKVAPTTPAETVQSPEAALLVPTDGLLADVQSNGVHDSDDDTPMTGTESGGNTGLPAINGQNGHLTTEDPLTNDAIANMLQHDDPLRRPITPRSGQTYFFLKLWNAKKQTLTGLGTYWVNRNENIGPAIAKNIISVRPHLRSHFDSTAGAMSSDDPPLDYYEEMDISTVRKLDSNRSFWTQDLQHCAIIIVSPRLRDAEKEAFLVRGDFADPEDYLCYLCDVENFPKAMCGYQTCARFSDEFYEGQMAKNHFHGLGKVIYHNGDTYTGPFCLGVRHSASSSSPMQDGESKEGTMVYANGDTYTGTWAHNLHDGHGTFTEAATGNVYAGGWRKGKRFGEGVTTWKVAEQEERLCKVCYDREVDTAFVDCGHVIACGEWAGRMVGVGCPLCRRDVRGTLRLWWT